MQICYHQNIPAYFLNIEFDGGEYLVYVCKDSGRKRKLTELKFKTYAEAKKFCNKHAPTFKVMNI